MTLREFVNVYVFATTAKKMQKNTLESMSETYKREYFFIPRVYCKDGFNISIQANNGNYCASENGTREFGLDWHEVEWGFPSDVIDPDKYNAENCSNIKETVGGYVDVDLLDSLLNEHGGIDLRMTLLHGVGLE